MGLISEAITNLTEPLSDDEQDLMSSYGGGIAYDFNTKDAQAMLQMLVDKGTEEGLIEALQIMQSTINYWQTVVQDLANINIGYNDTIGRWYNQDTGQFVRDPYTPITLNYQEFVDNIQAKYL